MNWAITMAKKSKRRAKKTKASGGLQIIECNHGCPPPTDEACAKFIELFHEQLRHERIAHGDSRDAVIQAMYAPAHTFPEALGSVSNREWLMTRLVTDGANALLRDKSKSGYIAGRNIAFLIALIGSYKCDNDADCTDREFLRNRGICSGCPRSTVQFFRRQIKCDCLDERYAAIKSGHSGIAACGGCGEVKESKALRVCGGCRREEYCSEACQANAWPSHKAFCLQCRQK